MGIEHTASLGSHGSAPEWIARKAYDRLSEPSRVARFDYDSAAVPLDERRKLTVTCDHREHWPTGGSNAVEFARNDQAFDFWAKRQ